MIQNWNLNTFQGTPITSLNLAGASSTVTPAPTVSFDSTIGSPNPGSLKVTATFTEYNQYIDPNVNLGANTVDATGSVVHVKLMLASGAFTGYASLHVQTGPGYPYKGGTAVSPLKVGEWTDLVLTMPPAEPAPGSGWDPSKVIQVGIQIGTGGIPTGGTAAFATPVDAVFYIDTLSN